MKFLILFAIVAVASAAPGYLHTAGLLAAPAIAAPAVVAPAPTLLAAPAVAAVAAAPAIATVHHTAYATHVAAPLLGVASHAYKIHA